MNIFKYILEYFKKIRSRFRDSTRNKATIQRIKKNTGKQIEDIEAALKDLINQDDKNEEQVEKIIRDKTAIEIGQKLEKQLKEPIFDLAEIEQELNLLNKKLFDIETRKQKINSVQNLSHSKTDADIENLEKLLQELDSKKGISSDSEYLEGFNDKATKVDSFFEEFKLIKVYRKREEKREHKEKLKKQKVNELLRHLKQSINSDKTVQTKQSIKIVEEAILGLINTEQKNKFRKKLSALRETFRKKEIEVEAKRQKEILKLKKEKEERKRKEEAKRLEEEKKKGIIVDDAIKNTILQKYPITAFYHMTALSNLESILQNGLLSHSEAYQQNLVRTDISDNEVNDRRQRKEPKNNKKIHDYVPFYFNPKNPMLYRRKDLQNIIVILEVDKRLIYQKSNLFTDGNAASNSTQFYNQLSNLQDVDWTALQRAYWNDYPDGKRIRCAEVLVFPKMPRNYILKIHSNNLDAMNKTRALVRNFGLDIPCKLSSKFYF